ncbi:hypothetical protein NDU88_005246 [Pleurodeles waltl]|uniref:Uncharacterized protein n=1 Tax=Pleurodeles waltl TaxID=8319 RepID=A0AAV7MVT9_PLEWA|nr:hypothetical protein NDU88_005246 [Pleurodeles waltl]
MAAERAPPPWRIPPSSGKSAGDRRLSASDRQNTRGSTASLLAVLPWSVALAATGRQGQNDPQSTWFLVENLLRGPQEKRYVENWCVCRFLLSTHGLASLFSTRGVVRRFPARGQSLSVDRGEYQMSRVCAWIFLLVFRLRVVLRGCASKFRPHGRRRVDFSWGVGRRCPCEAVRQSFDLMAGVASISPWKLGGVVLARPCVKVLISRQVSRRFLLGSRAALSLRGRASKFRSSRRRRVDHRRCAAFFLSRNKLCVEKVGARSVQVEERSLFGPETSGNRRQALSKPLESTFTARQEFSKAAGQQQGSSPL